MNISWRQLLSMFLVSFCAAITVLIAPASAAPSAGTDSYNGTVISATSRNARWTESVYSSTGPFGLEMTLQYDTRNSIFQSNAGNLGRGWDHSYSGSIVYFLSGASGSAIVEFATVLRPDGKQYVFKPNAGAWVGRADAPGRLNQTASGWTWTTRDGTVETYNTSGKLLTIADPRGLAKTFAYDTNDRLTQVTSPAGQTLAFAYDTSNRLSIITDTAGRATSLSYDAKNNLVRVGFPDTSAKLYHYENTSYPNLLTGVSYDNGAGSVTRDRTIGYSGIDAVSEQRAGGLEKFSVTQYSSSQVTVMDAASTQKVLTLTTNLNSANITAVKNLSDNKILTQTFNTNNNLTCKKDEEGRVTTYTYNSTNQKLSQTEGQSGACSAPAPTAETRTTTYQYLAADLDLPTLIESPSVATGGKKRVSISYDAQRNPKIITQSGFTPAGAAVARTVTMTYNASGQVSSIDGPRADVADVTTLTYYNCTSGGGCGQLQSVTNALGQTTTYDSYDANGRVLSLTDPNGLKTAYTYDPRGRVLSLTQTAPGGASRLTSYAYDAAGNVSSTSLPNGLTLTYTYNAASYLTRVVDSLGNRIDYGYDLKGNRTQSYTYDPSGALVRAVDMAFDARNRVSQLNTGGSITKQVWDAVGNLTAITDPNTVAANGMSATSNNYDSLNRLFKTVDLLSGNTQYAYDPNDRLKTVSAPNGANTQYQYDDLGNLLKEISPDRGTVSYAYDAAGNLTQQTDARGIVSTYGYDALNRLTGIDYPGSSEDITYTYDAGSGCSFGLGRLCAVADGAGSNAFSYDAFGNLVLDKRTELNVVYTTSYVYDALNRVIAITYPNGRQVTYVRNAKGDVQSVSMLLAGVTTTVVSAAGYRPDGLPLSRAFGNGLTDSRVYDTQGRLRELYLGSADTRLYGYDANGNLTGLQSLPEVDGWSYDLLNRLKQENRNPGAAVNTLWTYDANGNRKTQDTATYSYLANSNRLTATPNGSVTLDAAGNTTADGLGRSYSYNNAGQLSQVAGASYGYNAQRQRTRKTVGSQTTVYHYDLTGNLIAETTADGNLIRDYVWLDSTPLAQIEAGERIAYLHGDHLNTPRLATNASGVKVWSWEGEAFGNTPPNQDPDGNGVNTVINLRFPGQYWDAESGLHYNWNRYYDPKLCRYITSDPIGLEAGHNTYAYVENNPLRWVDPEGLQTICIRPGICAPVRPPVPIPLPGDPTLGDLIPFPPGGRDRGRTESEDKPKQCPPDDTDCTFTGKAAVERLGSGSWQINCYYNCPKKGLSVLRVSSNLRIDDPTWIALMCPLKVGETQVTPVRR